MRTLGIGMYWQDFVVGERFRTLARSMTALEIGNFINVTGMNESLFDVRGRER